MSLRIYEYELAGVKITAQLNEADAAMLNAVPVEETTQPQTERAPARKTRVPQNKARTNG